MAQQFNRPKDKGGKDADDNGLKASPIASDGTEQRGMADAKTKARQQSSANIDAGEDAAVEERANSEVFTAQRDTEWRRPYQDSPGTDTLAQTPEPVAPEPPNKVPIDPPNEPPSPNPVHIPPAPVRPGDLPASNPDVLSERTSQRDAADDKGLIERRPSVH